jgi:hypothetical protein
MGSTALSFLQQHVLLQLQLRVCVLLTSLAARIHFPAKDSLICYLLN